MTLQLAVSKGRSRNDLLRRGAEVIRTEADALHMLADHLGASFIDACELILGSSGRVVITGMGKSGHIGRKWAATFAATGTPAIYVHPAEAAHGDLGMLVRGDVLIVLSNSGRTTELHAFLDYAKHIGVPIVGVASDIKSFLMQAADIKLSLPAAREACPANIAPTTSTALQLGLGDALALTMMEVRGFSLEGLRKLHPGGSLGLRLCSLRDVMHGRDKLPLVQEDDVMCDVIVTMTSKGFGIAGVVDCAGRLVGVITDGDIRRHFADIPTATAMQVMTPAPRMLSTDMPAEEALAYLNENHITCAFVIDRTAPVNTNVPTGIIHVHDLLRLSFG
jgi:arabinose-5-phosphate isomerase